MSSSRALVSAGAPDRSGRSPERPRHFTRRVATLVLSLLLCATGHAQTPTPTERITFADAIKRAVEKNPTSQAAAAGILRAEGLLREARAATLLQVTGNITTTTLNKDVEFSGLTVTPQNSLIAGL